MVILYPDNDLNDLDEHQRSAYFSGEYSLY